MRVRRAKGRGGDWTLVQGLVACVRRKRPAGRHIRSATVRSDANFTTDLDVAYAVRTANLRWRDVAFAMERKWFAWKDAREYARLKEAAGCELTPLEELVRDADKETAGDVGELVRSIAEAEPLPIVHIAERWMLLRLLFLYEIIDRLSDPLDCATDVIADAHYPNYTHGIIPYWPVTGDYDPKATYEENVERMIRTWRSVLREHGPPFLSRVPE